MLYKSAKSMFILIYKSAKSIKHEKKEGKGTCTTYNKKSKLSVLIKESKNTKKGIKNGSKKTKKKAKRKVTKR